MFRLLNHYNLPRPIQTEDRHANRQHGPLGPLGASALRSKPWGSDQAKSAFGRALGPGPQGFPERPGPFEKDGTGSPEVGLFDADF